MSIILTAGKRAVKAKSAKSKKKRGREQFNPTPPLSSARTSVWYWELDGVPTTVMMTKESNEVWCNGQVLDTIDGFAEDDTSSGGHIDFCIYVEDTENVHKARIRRLLLGGHSGVQYELIVDGDMITEHSTSNSHMHLQRTGSCSEPGPEEEGAEAYDYMPFATPEDFQAAYSYPPPDPPSYNDVLAEDGGRYHHHAAPLYDGYPTEYAVPDEQKKYK